MSVRGALIDCGFFAENYLHSRRDLGVSSGTPDDGFELT
jgi:hypothetical protein